MAYECKNGIDVFLLILSRRIACEIRLLFSSLLNVRFIARRRRVHFVHKRTLLFNYGFMCIWCTRKSWRRCDFWIIIVYRNSRKSNREKTKNEQNNRLYSSDSNDVFTVYETVTGNATTAAVAASTVLCGRYNHRITFMFSRLSAL